MQVNLIRRKLVRTFSFVLLALFVVSACTAGGVPVPLTNPAANETAIAQAVEATLTAAIASPLSTPGDMPTPAASRPMIQLPAPLPNWQTIASKPGAERGSTDAPVVLVEYSDFQCPWCGRFFTEVMPQIEPMIEAGDVRLIYKHFPILGPASDVAARAAECASQQGDFWSLHDWLFANQTSWKASGDVETSILDAAATLGYDRAALDTCLDDPAILQAVSQDVQETQTFGFQGTPSFMLNGRLIPGFLPAGQRTARRLHAGAHSAAARHGLRGRRIRRGWQPQCASDYHRVQRLPVSLLPTFLSGDQRATG
jgi:protein-disulfide isomerase